MIADGKIFSTKRKTFTRNRWLMDWNADHRHATPEITKLHHLNSPLILVKHLHDSLLRIRIRISVQMTIKTAMATAKESTRRIRKRKTRRTLKKRILNFSLLVLMRNPFVLSMVNHFMKGLLTDALSRGAQSAIHLVGQLRTTAARTAEKSMLELSLIHI